MTTDYVRNISPGNKALRFIDRRLLDKHYRGDRSSQHNRFKPEEVRKTLELLNKYAPFPSLLPIRTTDLSKRPHNLPEEYEYARFIDEVNQSVGRHTQDTMKKNWFPDLHRMDLIVRYNTNGEPTDPWKQRPIKYVRLSEHGVMLLEADGLDEQLDIFTHGITRLLGGFITVLFRLLRDPDVDLKKVTIYEFMFFVSAIPTEAKRTSFSISVKECIDLILSFRRLSHVQRLSVIETLRERLQPRKFTGPKPRQRVFITGKTKPNRSFMYWHPPSTLKFAKTNCASARKGCALSARRIATLENIK